LNRRVITGAEWTVVHSPWCLERLRAQSPAESGRVVVIPFGSRARAALTAAERAATRKRFGLPYEALIVASFGSVTPEKMGSEALEAFRSVARSDSSAAFVFAGEEADGGMTRGHARASGLTDSVHFLGRLSAADYADLIAAVDVGLILRRPPTFGETSAALLDLLAAGVAVIVTEVATFADFPDSVVRKVRWDTHGPDALTRALSTLASDPATRAALGAAARDHVRKHHEWPRVAECYAEVIERCRGIQSRTHPPRRQPAGLCHALPSQASGSLALDGAGCHG
jgi:glycosyltransferase involved in cell wall biosynthesis